MSLSVNCPRVFIFCDFTFLVDVLWRLCCVLLRLVETPARKKRSIKKKKIFMGTQKRWGKSWPHTCIRVYNILYRYVKRKKLSGRWHLPHRDEWKTGGRPAAIRISSCPARFILWHFNHAGWRGEDLFIDLALLTCRERRSADAARDEADRWSD